MKINATNGLLKGCSAQLLVVWGDCACGHAPVSAKPGHNGRELGSVHSDESQKGAGQRHLADRMGSRWQSLRRLGRWRRLQRLTKQSRQPAERAWGLLRSRGTPAAGNTASFAGTNIWGRAPAHAKYPATFGGKVSEMFSVDGVLYGEGALWTAANCGCSDPTDKSGSNQNDHTLVWSSDLGKSWKIAPWKTATSFGSFLQFGKDYQGAADPDHLYFYYSGDANSDPSHVYLRRMAKNVVTADPATPGHFEYFTGVDSSGSPYWSTVAANAQPVFTDSNSPAGEGTGLGVVFDAPLGRYVAIEGHGEHDRSDRFI